jgi:glycosyltransferase involved in cell wall biosynthesis
MSTANGKVKRVGHIITRLSVGGAQENTLLTCEGLRDMPQYEVELVLGSDDQTEGELVSRARAGGLPVVVVPELMRSVSPLNDARALNKLADLFRERRYDIVHTHMTKAGVLGRIAARRAGTPLVVHTLHSLVYHDYQPRPVRFSIIRLKRWLARRTDHLISVSEILRQRALADGIGRAEAFDTVYSGMELDWFLNATADRDAVRASLGIPKDALVVGKIARFFELKGHRELLPAIPAVVAAVPDVRFLFVGDGVLLEWFKAEAAKLGVLDHLVFAGMLDREAIPDTILAMDVLVHTSLREGIARVLPQALAMGVPCVSFAIDGAPEVVIDGETGHLVAANDTAGLSAALIDLLRDPAERERMGRNGRASVDPRFRVETMVSDIAGIYERAWEHKFGGT